MQKKKCLRLNPADLEVLETLYLNRRLAVDQYVKLPKELRSLTDSFNALTGRADVPEDILHFMRTKRKIGKWPKLGDTARKVITIPNEIMTSEEIDALESSYVKIGKAHQKGNDSFAHEPELMRELENDFLKETGRFVFGSQLLAILTTLRKDGVLEALKIQKHEQHKSFDDMDEAANM
ncbi:MAG: hypothetical protein EHM20_01020 [Alphaproteobacteria bacterium]|nr:MAG: hypothetical protein EHM20_01020 [Alphaproteobacteria bacterium]